jgi:prevent-host-death family protein
MAGSITVSEARQDFADVVNRVAYGNERVTVVRRGRDLVAIVPMSDVLLLEAIEDELDLAAAREALADSDEAPRIQWTELRARLGR